MHIVHIAAEFAPLVKAGGLGEVLIGLSRALTSLGEKLDVIIPKYDLIPANLLTNLQKEIPKFTAQESSQEISNTMWSAQFENINLHLLEMHHPQKYFNRSEIYGYPDDVPRFLYFSKAAVEYLKIKQTSIDILHLHDWHTAPIASLARDCLKVHSIVLSIHNLEHQGKCGAKDLEAIGLKDGSLSKYHGADPKYPGSYNALKGGIETADAIVPVSPTYAKEILTPQYGCGLDPILFKRKSHIYGILNGIDEILWNPATDQYLKSRFKTTDPLEKIFAAKKENKQFLAKRFNLKIDAPWIGAITRIVPQKGPEFLEAAIEQTIKNGGVYTLLGSSPIPDLQHRFEQIKKHYQNNPQVLLQLDFDEDLAHQLYAALDFILLPSHFEPCGLAQLIGMHYGATPIVRLTGGLKDTVFDTKEISKQNGFAFEEPTIQAFLHTLNRAMKTAPEKQAIIRLNGLKTNFGWEKPAENYMTLYRKLLV